MKWATCNVGADKPEDYGLYLAWGETTGYTSDTSDGRSDSDKGVKKYSGSSTTTVASYTTSDTHIFLSVAGCRSSSGLSGVGSYGIYWSSSLTSSNSSYAYFVIFYSGYIGWGTNSRDCGQSVRPVCL